MGGTCGTHEIHEKFVTKPFKTETVLFRDIRAVRRIRSDHKETALEGMECN
jgi:hypothetical protein